MKRFLFAAALVALVASVGTAEEKPTAPATAAPVVITTAGTPVVEYAPAQSTRRGLLGRLRNRNSGSTMATRPAADGTLPLMTAPVMTAPASATPMPPISAPQPMPMPGTKTTIAPAGTIIQASGELPAGTYTTTDGTIIQIGGTQPQPAAQPMTETQSGRRGLFGRLRNR
jgi:hypothetical protein